jgi:hypothetical protein
MILLQSAYKILITRMRFKRRTISVSPFSGSKESTVQGRNVRIADKPPITAI